jgi:L-threonylcarbamoyladenylate synthase
MSEPEPARIPFRTAEEQERAVGAVVRHLEADGLIAYPTETVYGFGCALRPTALARLSAIKKRDRAKPFLLLVSSREMVPAGVEWTDRSDALARAFWPGPLTLALRVKDAALPDCVVSESGTVAIRSTPHPGVRRLVAQLGGPITSTSANEPGRSPAINAAEAERAIRKAAEHWPVLVLDGGPLPPSPPSTIVDCSTAPPRVVRVGAIGKAALAEMIHGSEPTRP